MVGRMKSIPLVITAMAAATVTALAGCGSGTDEVSDIEPQQAAETPTSAINSTDDLATHLDDFIPEVEAFTESETNPDFDADRDADRLQVEFTSNGLQNTDQKATADVIEAAAVATFDFDILMITGATSSGTWSYLYNSKTVEQLSDQGVVVDEVWDEADQDFDAVHS